MCSCLSGQPDRQKSGWSDSNARPHAYQGCSSCIKECKFGAIALYLGADIGGMGSKMTVNAEDGKLYWNIEKRDGTTEQVVINQKESNKY